MSELVTTEGGGELTDPRMAAHSDLFDQAPVQSENIIIPRILLTQAMSERAQNGDNVPGDIVGSLEGNTLAKKDGEFEFIPFKYFQTWLVKRVVNGKEEFDGIIPWTQENSGLAREEVKNIDGHDVVFKNYATINYYVLLNSELKNDSYMPYVISFNSFNHGIGKKLESHRARLAEFRTPIAFKTFKLASEDKENDKGKFKVFKLSSEIRDTTDEELNAVRKWHSIMQTKAETIKTDDSEFEAKPETTTTTEVSEDAIPF